MADTISSVLSAYSNPKEECRFQDWVEVVKGKKFHKKILVLGKFRLFLLKKGMFGKAVNVSDRHFLFLPTTLDWKRQNKTT